jgi:tetratricopeptide (TPR) repeat protein
MFDTSSINDAMNLGKLGNEHQSNGRFRQASECFTEALQIFQIHGHKAGQAGTLGSIAVARDLEGYPWVAKEYLLQALELHQALGDQQGEANDYCNLGIVLRNHWC